MGDYTVVEIDDIEAIAFGVFKRARATLGVKAFGLQVLDLPANADRYPEHDHSADGQEEVYVLLRGNGQIEIDDEPIEMTPDRIFALQPGTKRKLIPGDQGMRVLAIGGKAGEAYSPPDYTELGRPDPFVQLAG